MTRNLRRKSSPKVTRDILNAPIAGKDYVRIPPGEYDAVCYRARTGPGYGGHISAYLWFRITGGKFDGEELFMACRYQPTAELSPRHKYHQQWVRAANRRPGKGERLSFGVFKNRLFRVLVRDTQKRHSGGHLMADCAQYSVVDSIIEPMTGDYSNE